MNDAVLCLDAKKGRWDTCLSHAEKKYIGDDCERDSECIKRQDASKAKNFCFRETENKHLWILAIFAFSPSQSRIRPLRRGGDDVILLTKSVPSRLPKASPGCGKVGRGQALDLEGSRG